MPFMWRQGPFPMELPNLPKRKRSPFRGPRTSIDIGPSPGRFDGLSCARRIGDINSLSGRSRNRTRSTSAALAEDKWDIMDSGRLELLPLFKGRTRRWSAPLFRNVCKT